MAAKPQTTSTISNNEATSTENPSIQPEPLVEPTKVEAELGSVEPKIDPTEVVPKPEDEATAVEDQSVEPTDAEAVEIDPAEVTPLTGAQRRRSLKEMSKRPEWLPDEWKMNIRKRNSGQRAGEFDQYFVSPAGRRLRSKIAVMLVAQAASNATTSSRSVEEAPAEKKQKVESPPQPQETPAGDNSATPKETSEVS